MANTMLRGTDRPSPRPEAGADVPGLLHALAARVGGIEAAVDRLRALVEGQARHRAKRWYTTGELADALGVTQYTVQARWCPDGRIECSKDPASNRWRIPAREYDRLVGGGSLRAKAR